MFASFKRVVLVVSVLLLAGAPALGDVPWDVFEDTQSDSVCDVVNVDNHELVVLSDTGELVIVDGADTILTGTFVDWWGDVYYFDEPFGYIAFDLDEDGFRTLWWLGPSGYVVNVDAFTGTLYETDWIPLDYGNVPCDACDFWDDPADCTEIIIIDPDPPIGPVAPVSVNFCGAAGLPTLALTACGLVGLCFARRRW